MIEKVGILGAGVMGQGLAFTLAQRGFEVVLWDRKDIKNINKRLEKNIIYVKMNKKMKKQAINKIKVTINLDDMSNVDLILEAVIEDMRVKKTLLKKISKICSHNTIISTNTSSLSIDQLSRVVYKPRRFIGLHFFNPPNKMKLIEIIKNKNTSSNTISQAIIFIKRLDKTPIVIKDSPGFIVNRLLFPLINDAANLLEERIATKEDIDNAMRLGANFPIGPLQIADLVGIDTTYKIINELHRRSKGCRIKPSNSFKKLIKNKKLGQKNEMGFYLYKK